MNTWILHHYAHPPDKPRETRHYDLAREMVKQGHLVSIFAPGSNHLTQKASTDRKPEAAGMLRKPLE